MHRGDRTKDFTSAFTSYWATKYAIRQFRNLNSEDQSRLLWRGLTCTDLLGEINGIQRSRTKKTSM